MGFHGGVKSVYSIRVNEEHTDAKNELILDLNFVPKWAQQPPEANPYARFESDGGRRDRRPDSGFRPPSRDSRPPRDRRPPRRGEPSGDRRDRPAAPRPFVREREPQPEPMLALEVAFLPERQGMITVARRIAKSARAYSLFDLASLFLSRPEYCSIRVSVPRGEQGETVRLFQCQVCKSIFLDRGRAQAHVLGRHLDAFYTKEEEEVPPPQGQFVCVARCGLSGELLGPPNYHGFNDRVLELHRARFAHLPLDEYRRRIENVHDAAVIEQWKERMCRRTIYRIVNEPEAAPIASFSELETHFAARHAAAAIKEGASFTLPGPASREIDDPDIRRQLTEAWNRESRFPLRLSITLRLALRHLGLHTFKTGEGGSFVTALAPSPIDPAQAIDVIREILSHLAEHPGCERAALLGALRPEAAADSPELHEFANQVRWLVDKGHVIEFSDGRLAVPRGAVHKVQHAKREERRPKPHHHHRDRGSRPPGSEPAVG